MQENPPPPPVVPAEKFVSVDMHLHTRASLDAFNTVDTILRIAAQEGFGVAITDHNEIAGAIEAASKAKEVLVVPGIELKAGNGVDVLVYFHDVASLEGYYVREVEPYKAALGFFLDRTEEELIEAARGYDCVIAAPHPYAPQRMGLAGIIEGGHVRPEVMERVHLVEGGNGTMSVRANKLGAAWGKSLGKPLIAGSDAHTARFIGTMLTGVTVRPGERYLDALLRGETQIIDTKLPQWQCAMMFLAGQAELVSRKGGWRVTRRLMKCARIRRRRPIAKLVAV